MQEQIYNLYSALNYGLHFQLPVLLKNSEILPFYFCPLVKGWIQNWANRFIYKYMYYVCNEIWCSANSKLCKSVSDLYKVKIRLGKYKAVSSIVPMQK